jgi:small subunit ribosomal protein S20
MPNTKSAERRMRSSARRALHNRHAKTTLKSLEKRYVLTLKSGQREDATKAFQQVSSALDKAAKTGVIHRSKANRKKSRLAVRLATVK